MLLVSLAVVSKGGVDNGEDLPESPSCFIGSLLSCLSVEGLVVSLVTGLTFWLASWRGLRFGVGLLGPSCIYLLPSSKTVVYKAVSPDGSGTSTLFLGGRPRLRLAGGSGTEE